MKQIILHLSLIPDIGPAVVGALVEQHNKSGNLADLYALSATDIRAMYGFSMDVATKIVRGLDDRALLEKELVLIEKHRIQWATAWCAKYPQLLKEIYLPPTVLYWQGTLASANRNAIALVGSRKMNEYGDAVIEQLVPPLVAADWTIVSGGALGADTGAHEAALAHGGTTIAVLGSGLLCPYPLSNKKLFANIAVCGGAVVSAFPLTMEALPGNFPARNRIISGLSRGTVVVQAAQKSGALITARYALEQGREVFAVPGAISDPLSAGCHTLIAQGAKLVTQAHDILAEFGVVPMTGDTKSEVQMPIAELMPVAVPAKKQIIDISTPSGRILHACRVAATLDDLVAQTGLSMAEVQDLLFDLQLEGKVAQNYAGMWSQAV